VKVGKFIFRANGRALSSDSADGFVKLIADAKTDRLLGAQIIGANASELIAEVVSVMEFHGSAEDLARTVHAHPTLSEATKEAALAVDGRAIHA
jgi:dihydrolipoamide dehydrogenase